MPKRLSLSNYQSFPLFPLEVGDDTSVTIKQATQGAVESIGELMSVVTRNRNNDDIKSHFNPAQAVATQVYATLIESNLLAEDGTVLFPTKENNGIKSLDLSEAEFKKRWAAMPPDWCDKVYDRVLEVNEFWDILKQQKLSEQSQESTKTQ